MPKSQLKFDPTFNMSSMTDIVFLLLIFFMLTSNFVTPSAVEVNVPTSNAGGAVMPKLTITISEAGKFYVNKQEVAIEQMKDELKSILTNSGDKEVVLHAENTTPIQKIIQVMDIGHELGIKVQLAVEKE
jgi:biopolymer transport protein ExbD